MRFDTLAVHAAPPEPETGEVAPPIRLSTTFARDEHNDKLVGVLAKSWKRIDEKTLEFELRDNLTFHSGNTFTAADVLGISSLVFRTGLIAVGTSAKYARQMIGGYTADAWAGDVGIAIAVFDLMAFGASVQNLGGDLGEGARLPRRTRVGFTMNYVDPQGGWRLLTTLEGQWPSGRAAFLLTGVEAGVVTRGVGIVGRAGYAGHSAPSDASPFTFGAGVELGALHFDYAFRQFDVLGGGTHRFGVRWTP